MKNLNRLLILALISEVSLLFIQSSQAYFSDTAVSINNTFTAIESFTSPTPSNTPTPTPTIAPGELLINEVFQNSDNVNEWVELINKSDRDLNVSGMKIADGNTFLTPNDIFPAVSPIPVGGYAVVITSESEIEVTVPVSALIIKLTDNNIGSGLNISGDAIGLFDENNIVIDAMSYGDNTSVFLTSAPKPTPGQSLVRIPNGNDTNTDIDWNLDDTPTIGEENIL